MRPNRNALRRLFAFGAIPIAILGASGVAAGSVPCWRPPVLAPVTDPYREPPCRWCPGNRGLEYDTRTGTPVRAVAAGHVTFAGSVAGRRYVVIAHPGGVRTTYGDLIVQRVERGAPVVAGSVVGLAGSTFHFGVRDHRGYRDPAPLLGQLTYPPRLVPRDGSAGGPPGPARLRCATDPSRRR
jgi:murein DD-endopeptidase MepM/ murein hydrolase activator NlpD